jgi:hypothetical protein
MVHLAIFSVEGPSSLSLAHGEARETVPYCTCCPGDPPKIADVIVRLANSDEVPRRLILRADAEQRVQRAEAARSTEAAKWRHLTISRVFDDERFNGQLYKATGGSDS